MASSTEICNLALVTLGQEPVITLDDSTKSSRLCSRMYDPVLEATLRAYPWTFAIKRTVMALSAESPAFGYAYKYTFPTDYLRMVEHNITLPYVVEGNEILTDFGDSVYLRYVAKVTDPNKFDSQFIQVLYYKLACAMCIALTADQDLYSKLMQLSTNACVQAQNSSAIEAEPQQVVEGTWIPSRY